MHFYELKVNVDSEFAEIIIAELANIGYDSFTEEIDSLSAFVEDLHFDEIATKQLMEKYATLTPLSYEIGSIERKNWNEEWEKSFEPITIADQVYVRADFHPPVAGFAHEVIITPKMSFGTGHHETTSMVMQHQLGIDHVCKSVLDIGCGTGILAILAMKLGATVVEGFDIDEWSVENSIENTQLNACEGIVIRQGTIETEPAATYDILLANINRNILIDQIPAYVKFMKPQSILIVSGFYEKDIADIETIATQCGLQKRAVLTKNNWASVVFEN